MVIYSGFTHKKWWFPIVFCMFTRGYVISYMSYICSWWNLPIFCASGRRSLAHLWWLLRRLEISSWSDAVPERRRVQVPAPDTDLKSSLGIKNPRSWSQSKKASYFPSMISIWYPYDIHMISIWYPWSQLQWRVHVVHQIATARAPTPIQAYTWPVLMNGKVAFGWHG